MALAQRSWLGRAGLGLGLGLGLALLAVGGRPAPRVQAALNGWRTLTGRLPNYTGFFLTLISPDSQYAVYTADVDLDQRFELYSVALAGGPPVKLNPALVSGGDVRFFAISPDSAYVIYTADQEVDERTELYRVPIGGGPAVKLNGPLVNGGNVVNFYLDAGSQRVAYRADEQANDVYELFSVLIAGGGWVKLNPPLTAGGDVDLVRLDPVGGRVVYRADAEADGLSELYSVLVGGGGFVKLNQPLVDGVTVFRIAPGYAYVLYTARAAGTDSFALYANDTAGGEVRTRSLSLAANEGVYDFAVSPTGQQVSYVVYDEATASGTLYRASSFAGASQQLSETPGAGGGVYYYEPGLFSADGARVVFRYRQSSGSPIKLQSAYVLGGPLNRVDLFVPQTGHQGLISQLSPDGQWVVYVDENTVSADPTLYAVPTSGGSSVYLGASRESQIMPDSGRVVLNEASGDLLSVQIFGGGVRNLSRKRAGEALFGPVISADGQWVLYQVAFEGGGAELRVSDGSAAPEVYEVLLPLAAR